MLGFDPLGHNPNSLLPYTTTKEINISKFEVSSLQTGVHYLVMRKLIILKATLNKNPKL